MSTVLHVGLVVNPIAGLGGSLARKGSDGSEMRGLVSELSQEARLRSEDRAVRALGMLTAQSQALRFSTWGGSMGENALQRAGIAYTVIGSASDTLCDANDTVKAASKLLEQGIDLLLFVGGDGTARDVLDAVGTACPVLGIPAGVKMHSGVFAVSPEAAGELLQRLCGGGLVSLNTAEVRDIDEQATRADIVKSRFYGEMKVPAEGRFLQHTKVGGTENATLVASEIAAWIVEHMVPDCTYLIGPGSTTAAITQELGLATTLLGVDVVRDAKLLASDADEQTLLSLIAQSSSPGKLIVTAIGGQGHVFGRGNQQFSPTVIRSIGRENIQIVAAKSKISALEGRPLLVDTNDPELDGELQGYYDIITGYDDRIFYPIASAY